MEASPIRYVKTLDGHHLAYRVVGDGPIDVIIVPPSYSHVQVFWEVESLRRWYGRLAAFSRVILFDKRGSGMSDPVLGRRIPSPEEWMDDIATVLDVVGSRRAAILGDESGGAVGMLFAATYPERVTKLVLQNSFARLTRAEDYPWGMPKRAQEAALQVVEEAWATGTLTEVLLPPDASRETREGAARLQRLSMPPGVAVEAFRATNEMDVRRVLPVLRLPVLVLYSAGDRYIRPEHSRYLAAHIEGAQLVEIPGEHGIWFDRYGDVALDHIREFLTGSREPTAGDRVLATVLFTDLANSTRLVAELGDERWKALLDTHDDAVRRCLRDFRGTEVHTTGDGFLARFDGPGRAVQCAQAIRAALSALGLEVRSGVHTGEVELRGDDVAGIAVHIGARVMAMAAPGEVLVSGAVPPLVAGSGLVFRDRGEHELKGVPGAWRVFVVE